MNNLNIEHRKLLHGQDYVDKFDKEQSAYRIKRLLKYVTLSKEYVVADFACGNGMLLDHIHDKVEKYIGVDFSQPFVMSANRRMSNKGIENAEFICGSIKQFCNIHNNIFDVGFD
ncbi:MAG: class I SAM-dependent methyltransferase [Planctomycetaceae bacterium]|nr:MAG: class I SAM-dependent methyltransferase [Planctomycetaceae bacterium]